MSFLKRLFGGGGGKEGAGTATETYAGCRIVPEPMKDGGGWRLAARVEKTVGEEVRVHRLIRADTFQDRDAAISASVSKAKQLIDEQGDRLFD